MKCDICTLYSHNLNEPHKSFNTDLTLKDFKIGVQWSINDAKFVYYINPRGDSVTLKVPKKKAIYDIEEDEI